jgi:hypothetical protein
MKGVKPKSIADRFHQKYVVDKSTGCWEWTGATAGKGYPVLLLRKVNRRTVLTYGHRFSYELYNHVEIPEDREIDHTCRNQRCVNPKHLQLVTHRENMLLGDTIASRNASRTHCVRGHPYSKENTWINKRGDRCCKRCWKIYRRRYKRRHHI